MNDAILKKRITYVILGCLLLSRVADLHAYGHDTADIECEMCFFASMSTFAPAVASKLETLLPEAKVEAEPRANKIAFESGCRERFFSVHLFSRPLPFCLYQFLI